MTLWNGNRAALSLTFDDGLACQVNHALPIMTKRNVPGTFFLVEHSEAAGFGPLDRSVWRDAIAAGHEIGSHSSTHCKAAALDTRGANREAQNSKSFLERELGTVINSYCYPYTDAPGFLQTAVKAAGYKQGRGGRVARQNKFVVPGDGVNFFNVPCYHVNGGVVPEVSSWLSAALWRGAWVTLMLHGVGPDESQWDNIDNRLFDDLLDTVCRARAEGLWVTTFGEAAESLRQHQEKK